MKYFQWGIQTDQPEITFDNRPEPYTFEIEINLEEASNKFWLLTINEKEFRPYALKGNN